MYIFSHGYQKQLNHGIIKRIGKFYNNNKIYFPAKNQSINSLKLSKIFYFGYTVCTKNIFKIEKLEKSYFEVLEMLTTHF